MKQLIIMLILFNLIISCNPAQSSLDNAESAISYAEQNKNEMNAEDWSDLEMKMAELEKELKLNREKFTTDQVKDIRKLQGRYASLILKKGINNFQNSLEDLGNQMEGFLEGFKNDTI